MRAVLPALCVIWGLLACQVKRPPELGALSDDAGIDASPSFAGALAGAPILQCSLGPDGGVCDCVDVDLLETPPLLHFALDRSGSMNDSNKWSTVRQVVGETVMQLGPRISVAASVFPDPSRDGCSPGLQVFPPRRGDPPAGTIGPTLEDLAKTLDLLASGATPTAKSLAIVKTLVEQSTGRRYVILATDGGPNCNDALKCDVSECLPNIESVAPTCQPDKPPNCCDSASYGSVQCLDGAATVKAVNDIAKAGVPVYVVGVPGSGPYASLLNKMAEAGGTARAADVKYYRVDSTDAGALRAALTQVAAAITGTCEFDLKDKPTLGYVNVYADNKPLTQDGNWTLSDKRVTLIGPACDRVLRGDVLNVRVVVGCPTIIR